MQIAAMPGKAQGLNRPKATEEIDNVHGIWEEKQKEVKEDCQNTDVKEEEDTENKIDKESTKYSLENVKQILEDMFVRWKT